MRISDRPLLHGKSSRVALKRTNLPLRSIPAQGFTLVEVLVATTLFVLVLTTVYSAFRGIMDANRRAENAIESSQTARMILSDISSKLANIYHVPDSKHRERSISAAVLPASVVSEKDESGRASMSLITDFDGRKVSHRLSPGLSCVRYVLKPGAIAEKHIGNTYSLFRECAALGSPETIGAEAEPVLLTNQVNAMGFRFLHPKTGEWRPTWGSAQGLPAAVAVDLVLREGAAETARQNSFSTVVALPKVISLSELPPSRAALPIGTQSAEQPKIGADKPAPVNTDLKPQDPAKPRELPDAGSLIRRN